MSFSLGVEGQAVIEAITACERVSSRLLEFIDEHARAASVARPDWSGPNRDRFEDRFAGVQRALIEGGFWVLQTRRDLVARLDELTLAAQAAAELQTTGPR